MVDSTGFVTALVINVVIALVAFILFIVWRPRFPGVEPPTVPPGYFAWATKILQLTDAQVLEAAGLDALMCVKFFELGGFLFLLLCTLGIGILLPVNYTASGNVSDAFDQLSMANIPSGNRRFWVHLTIGYLFSAAFYYMNWHMWRSYLNLRHQFLAKWTLLGGNHTIMLHNLPADLRTDAALLAYFQRLYPGQIRSARMAKDLRMDVDKDKGGTNELPSLPENVANREEVIAALEHDIAAYEKQQADPKLSPEKKAVRAQVATKYLCCAKVDAIDFHYAELQRLNALISEKQQQFISKNAFGASRDPEQVPTLLSGFVTFHSARTAVAASKAFVYDTTAFSFEAKAAPELRDVYWPSLNFTHSQRAIRTVLFNIATAGLILGWMIPMGILMGVSNLTGLAEKYSWLSGIHDIPTVILGFIEAYLPALMLIVFFAILPQILLFFAKEQGIEANSWLQKSVIHKYYLFMVINFFFGAIVGGAIFSNISALFSDINSVPRVLGEQIPTVSTYFTVYVAMAAFAGFPIQMTQVGRLLVGEIKKRFLALTPREFEVIEAPPACDYGVIYCPHLFIFLIAITYSVIAPIIIPFAAAYFLLGWIVMKVQLVHVFVQQFESGGSFWPVVYSKMSSSLFIAQICLVGILGLKEVPAPAALVVPLPIITILFDRYIHQSIKVKLHSVPLAQLVEIDAMRKADRIKKEEAAGKGAGEDGVAKDQDGEDVPAGKSVATFESATATASGVRLQQRGSSGAATRAEEKDQGLGSVKSAFFVPSDDASDVEKPSASGAPGTRASVINGPVGPQKLGFAYADDEQHRAYVEGDVSAYVQPELTTAVLPVVQVPKAEMYLSANVGGAAIRVAEVAGAKKGEQMA